MFNFEYGQVLEALTAYAKSKRGSKVLPSSDQSAVVFLGGVKAKDADGGFSNSYPYIKYNCRGQKTITFGYAHVTNAAVSNVSQFEDFETHGNIQVSSTNEPDYKKALRKKEFREPHAALSMGEQSGGQIAAVAPRAPSKSNPIDAKKVVGRIISAPNTGDIFVAKYKLSASAQWEYVMLFGGNLRRFGSTHYSPITSTDRTFSGEKVIDFIRGSKSFDAYIDNLLSVFSASYPNAKVEKVAEGKQDNKGYMFQWADSKGGMVQFGRNGNAQLWANNISSSMQWVSSPAASNYFNGAEDYSKFIATSNPDTMVAILKSSNGIKTDIEITKLKK